ncbi:protein-associating with the carboxyl-terminal domain of ezrin isoform X2 [Maniola jurtina]|uniref:protein-associating with the carboxyl-terminal domain of ezrin isoform X2 n=1 Tax=Maniola jurtina TaxID=191418 RepID=UPI001E68AF67|nr:protein-associating with the carboxyl-terminal domain of ezrin isoform X2 [Maniola jurtina]
MMGNDTSQLNSLEIEEKATEITDFWAHHQATISDSCRYFSLKSDGSVSVFKGETILGPLWTASTPLEKFSNASMSHNNISLSSIYVSGDGQWKLAGLQYLCPFSELNAAYLKHSRIHRYDKAVDPNEDSYEITSKVDQYAFAVLVEDVFKGHNDDEVPHLKEFKKYCRNYLQNPNPERRPNLSEVLRDNFFNHEFISIYKFLNFLPLKTEEEKSEFFSSILSNLKGYDEVTVAKQLGGLLLSRLTLLDQTARRDVLPFLLKPKNDRFINGECMGFFTLSVFKEHVKPRLLQLFGVRDGQIRMLLLSHFTKFVHVFTHEELSQHILPELLVGIKDTDDSLVASTLICLSELVPILGADTVVGGKRSKLFTDGRPKSTTTKSDSELFKVNKGLTDFHCSERIYPVNTGTSTYDQNMSLNERPSPVGGESNDDIDTVLELNRNANIVSEDEWDDWENTNQQLVSVSLEQSSDMLIENKISIETNLGKELINNDTVKTENGKATTHSTLLHKAAVEAKKNMVDISELDIKNQKVDVTKKNDEIDFFADMMPVIEKQKVVTVNDNTPDFIHKLNFIPDEGDDENEAWGENWNE